MAKVKRRYGEDTVDLVGGEYEDAQGNIPDRY